MDESIKRLMEEEYESIDDSGLELEGMNRKKMRVEQIRLYVERLEKVLESIKYWLDVIDSQS